MISNSLQYIELSKVSEIVESIDNCERWLILSEETLKTETSNPRLRKRFVMKKFALEAIIQVARSLGTKSLKPFNNDLQRIKHRFSGVKTYKGF